MKIEEFNKMNEELNEEINKNNEKIIINSERINILNANQAELKAIITIALSVLTLLGLVFAIIAGIKGNIPAFTRFISGKTFPLVMVGCSLGVGTIGRKLLERKIKLKEKLKSFTSANTHSEKLEEKIKYEIELEKAKNRNKAILQSLDSLKLRQLILKSLASKDNISNKKTPQTMKEAQKEAKELSVLLKEKEEELDLLTNQKVLYEKFWRIRSIVERVVGAIGCGLIGGCFTMACFDVPLLLLQNYGSVFSGLSFVLAPFIIGTVGVSGYVIKRDKDSKKVFDNLNEQLGENALPDKEKKAYEELKDIDAKLKRKIREVSILKIQLQDQKKVLESFKSAETEKEQILEPSVEQKNTIQNPKEVNTYNQDYLYEYIDRSPSINTDMETEKGPTLSLRKKH